jgi:hypothetical protein
MEATIEFLQSIADSDCWLISMEDFLHRLEEDFKMQAVL